MRKPTKDRAQILCELTEVFRQNGYDGTTLSKLTEKTGLERASLYHYFPGGKRAMAEAVLTHVLDELSETVLAALNSSSPPTQRLTAMLDATHDFYNGGQDLCFVSIFAIGENSEHITSTLRQAVMSWLDSLATTLGDAGKPDARSLANVGLSCIQGGLVLAGVTRNSQPFVDAISFLRQAWCVDCDDDSTRVEGVKG
ncbi:MAG: TetR/AcrR family transcriptional regulator [Leptolyngbyaceae cyanobacterium MAG.088]|nr:TetR/AcrR family transcriptional regulator [Leptolyngbyaceae cyanobacterium MAG.088]